MTLANTHFAWKGDSMKTSRKVIQRFFILFVFSAIFTINGPAPAIGAEITIGPPDSDRTTIQTAIDTAGNGDTIWVEDGTYSGPGNRDINFGSKIIYLRSVSGNPEDCIIDCENAGRGFSFDLLTAPGTTVSGFSIINGFQNANSGGGIYCTVTSPTIENCIINGNSAVTGGGVFCVNGASPILQNCTISGNVAADGGGLFCDDGASPILENCTINGNSATGRGGGISCGFASSPTIKSSTISENSASIGGGLFCFFIDSSTTLENCIISGNSASSGGGLYCDLSSPLITNCTISGNSASSGGGLFCYGSSAPELTNTIMESNIPDGINESDTYSDPLVKNCLFFGHPGGDYFDFDNSQYYTGETAPGTGLSNTNTLTECTDNLYGDPLLADGDYYPETCASPAVDTGITADSPTADIAGTPRPQGVRYDMGVFESIFPDTDFDLVFDGCDNCRLNPNTDQSDADDDGIGDACEGDFNYDGVIDMDDLDIIVANLNEPASSLPACDLDSDGTITTLDLRALIGINPLLARDRRVRILLRVSTTRSRR
jgi:hypothetical protein